MSSQTLCLEVGELGVVFKLKNEIALKMFQDQTLLGKSFFDILSIYVPRGITTPENTKDAVEIRFKSLCAKVQSVQEAEGQSERKFS